MRYEIITEDQKDLICSECGQHKDAHTNYVNMPNVYECPKTNEQEYKWNY
tara:strand:+ start:453 stop:602 length:150 start_codon:yes stop_codon:yes gene_type:complete